MQQGEKDRRWLIGAMGLGAVFWLLVAVAVMASVLTKPGRPRATLTTNDGLSITVVGPTDEERLQRVSADLDRLAQRQRLEQQARACQCSSPVTPL